jgi:hypothetical protein
MSIRSDDTGRGGFVAVDEIDIRPGVAMLGLFPHMKYQPWYAISELVDNAIQSDVTNRAALAAVDGGFSRLKVEIDISSADGGTIVVRDNAAGISTKDWVRAFQVAVPPSDRTGLSQFGVGMKASCCWFARHWSLRTSALEDDVIRSVDFNVPEIVASQNETLEVVSEPAPPSAHFTEIRMTSLYRTPQTNTLIKIADYLGSIYREFIRQELVDITFNGSLVTYADPPVLVAPYYRTPEAEDEAWERPIDIALTSGRRVTGFAALRQRASTTHAGFALLYRKKVVVGAGVDDSYRPLTIFGRSNTFRSQRLFGELNMDDFEVASSKDALLFYDEEEELLMRLKQYLDDEGILGQAEGFRARNRLSALVPEALPRSAAAEPVQDVHLDQLASTTPATPISGSEVLPPPLDGEPPQALVVSSSSESGSRDATPPSSTDAAYSPQHFTFARDGVQWQVELTTINDLSHQDWIEVSRDGSGTEATIQVTLNVAQGAVSQAAGDPASQHSADVELAVRLALAQELARLGGATMPGRVLSNFNELLRHTLDPNEATS